LGKYEFAADMKVRCTENWLRIAGVVFREASKGELMAKILIVDDDPDVVEVATMLLKGEGHEVLSAGSREEGLKQVNEAKPDLLVLDIMLDQPDDGVFMAQELRRAGFDKPILMFSGISKITGMDFDKDDEIVPVDAFQEKPVDPAVFVAKVKELLGKGE
jgi:DNA-binding response OmpR family regulator